ncbi:MAG: response regulator, partial [Coxiellaceae bacterium]|nr:response regulator [Coxiellaceae bacterium]
MSNQKMIKVLIVEDSKVVATILESIFNADPNIEVIATATNGEEAVELTQKLKPDLITMDIEMPKLNGLEATTTIMRENPTPIIIITSLPTGNDSGLSFDALNAGALTIIEKPVDISSDGFQSIKQNLLRSVKALHDIHVIRRRVSKTNSPKSRSSEPNDFKILAI